MLRLSEASSIGTTVPHGRGNSHDAIQMARDAISLKVADLELDEKEIPTPMTYEEGFAKVSKEYGCLEGIMTYADINTESYLSRLKNKSVCCEDLGYSNFMDEIKICGLIFRKDQKE